MLTVWWLYDRSMVKTYGLTHLALAVKDAERALRFYAEVFGMEADIFVKTVESMQRPQIAWDVITFDETASKPGEQSGIMHFGFRLQSADDIEVAVQDALKAGGKLLSRGELVQAVRMHMWPIQTDMKSRFGMSERQEARSASMPGSWPGKIVVLKGAAGQPGA